MKLGVVVLAGGRGERLGRVSKADVDLGGRRFLDWVLDDVAALSPLATVVVAQPTVAVPAGVIRTLEEPGDGGPSAGLLAGYSVLPPVDAVAVLAVDAPRAARQAPSLLAALTDDVDGAIGFLDGYRQPLLGAYWSAVFDRWREQFGTGHNMAVKRLLEGLNLTQVEVSSSARDVDTVEDLALARDRSGRAGLPEAQL